jgi:Tol biopolymer transport system component
MDHVALAFALGASLTGCDSGATRALPSSVDASVPPERTVAPSTPEPAAAAPVDASTGAPQVADASPAPPATDCAAREFPIAFASTRAPPSAAEYELFIMKEDGSEVRRIGRGGHFTNPVWAPDGASIAFHHVSPMLASYFGVISPDEQIATPITLLLSYPLPSDVGALPDGPSWSRDGSTLAFALPSDSGRWHIELMSRTGGQQRALMPDLEESHGHPSFARQSDRLAYVLETDAGSDIWLVDVNDPTQRENLTQGRVAEPASPRWAPDDTRIAFSARDPEPDAGVIGESEIFVLTVATGAIRRVTEDVVVRNRHPSWSPDGESLVYSSARQCGASDACNDLWRVRVDGSEPPLQLTTTAREFFPDWYGGGTCAPRVAP